MINKRTILAILLLGFVVLIGCDAATNAGTEKSVQNTNKETLKNSISVAETPLPIHQIKSKQPLIWVGTVNFSETALESPGSFFGGNAVAEEFPGEVTFGTTVEVDLMNCAGFLATAKLVYTDIIPGKEPFPPDWQLRVTPEKVASDIQEKIKLCQYYSESPNFSNVFAVAPLNNERRNIKIKPIDTHKLYASLPQAKREWLEEEKAVYKTDKESRRQREARNLTLQNDNWTDADGDGKIDLVEIKTICERDDPEGNTCSVILMLINGKWVEIGSTA